MHDEKEKALLQQWQGLYIVNHHKKKRIEVAARFEANGVSVGFETHYHNYLRRPPVSAIDIIEVQPFRVLVA